jgi:hypothetical protein
MEAILEVSFPQPSILSLGSTQLPIQWVPGHLAVQRPECGDNHSI